MRDIALTLAVFGSLPFILKRPYLGILMWSWLGFMNPHRLAYGFAYSLPFAQIVAITTLVGLAMSKEPKKIPWTRESVLMLIFLLWMLVTTSMAYYPEAAWEQMNKVAKIFLMIFVAMMLINTRERLIQLVWVIALSLGFFGVKGGIFTITTGGVFRVQGPAGSFIEGNNEMGLALAMTIPLMYVLAQQAKQRWLRYGMIAAAVLTALAALGTQSRGAMLGMVGMAVFFWLKSRNKFATTILLAASIPMLLALMPPEWYARMSTINTYEEDGSAMGRIYAWKFAYALARERLVGGGFDVFHGAIFDIYTPDAPTAHDAHSIYFGVLGHHGFPGLGIFLMLIVFTWLSASTVLRAAKKDGKLRWLVELMAMTQVSLIAYLTAGAFLGLQYFDYFYNLILIVVMGRVILSRHVAAKAAGKTGGASDASTVGNAAKGTPGVPVGSLIPLGEPPPRTR